MPKSSHLVKPIAAIVCDDIRQEASLKDILIGIYSGDILLKRAPTRLRLCVYLLAEIGGAGKGRFELRLQGPNGVSENTVRAEFEGVAATPPKHRVGLAFNGMFINLADEGEMTVQFRKEGGRWTTIGMLPVNIAKGPATPASGPAQPS